MYFSFIRPILEYGDVIWDSNIQYLADKIETMRIVTDGTKLTSINELYDETGWEKLADRRTNQKCWATLCHEIPGEVRSIALY
jgi:hypothetical protein